MFPTSLPSNHSTMKSHLNSLLALLLFTSILHSISTIFSFQKKISIPLISLVFCFLYHLHNRPFRVFLLNYSCYKPPPNRKCTFEVAESFVLRNSNLTEESIDFMRNIYLKSGLGDETYGPPFIFQENHKVPILQSALQEAEEGIFSSIEALLLKSSIHPQNIDVLIVTSGSFSPSPSLCSLIVNRYNLKPDVKTYNLSGMGCSSGILSIDLAARVLRSSGRKITNALVIITESITSNWYSGENRSMLVTNCIFRVGCTAAMMSNDPHLRRFAKMELVKSLRTHHGADDRAYHAAFQEEDDKGNTGISLTKDLIRVAGVNLHEHIRILAPRVLPLSQLFRYAYCVLNKALLRSMSKSNTPDFTTAFEHMCIHTGGKAVIENVGRVLEIREDVTEPARMSLNRFGNTSSSLVFYELAYFEAKEKVKRGDRMWMLAFGTGFKVGSLVWRWLKDSNRESDNPWNDCIQMYPVKAW